MNEKVLQALNSQIKMEFEAAYLYLNMHVAMTAKNLNGFAQWLYIQWHEELEHAEKIINYVHRRSLEPEIQQIEVLPVPSTDPVEVAKAILEHEQKVSRSINDIRQLAREEGDQATEVFLNWFVNEQVEEEENAQGLVDLFTFVNGDKAAMMAADHGLGKRHHD